VLELVPGVEVVAELPVVYIRSYKAVILADVHIGYEEEVSLKGGYIPRFQLRHSQKILEEVFGQVRAERIIFAGDLKHLFNTLGRVERIELLQLLNYVKRYVDEVVVVRGNHDNFLPAMKRWVEFNIVESYLAHPYLIIHGHKPLNPSELPQQWDYLIMGHEHPSIALRDPIGVIGKFSCFLVGDTTIGKKLIVLPAVGAYQTGSKVTLSKDTYLSPVIRDYAVIESLKPVVVGADVGVLEFPTLGELYDIVG